MADLSDYLRAPVRLPASTPPAMPTDARFFRWRDAWCLGIPAMDRDHRRLAALLDSLACEFTTPVPGADGARRPRHPSHPGRLLHGLAMLGEEAREHFAREEVLMRAADYPDLAEHRAEHRIMCAELTELVRDIAARDDCCLDLETMRALKAWFLGHLLDTDRRLARHLLSTGFGLRH